MKSKRAQSRTRITSKTARENEAARGAEPVVQGRNRIASKAVLKTNENLNIWVICAILLFTIIIYANSLRNGFIYFDDPELVLDNYSIRQITWDNFVYYFTTPVQFTYLPVGLISYAIDYQIGELNPYIYHFTNLLVHLGAVVLAYWLFQLLTGKPRIAIFVAGLFAIHPVNVDNVAWVATRNNLLTTFFYLGSLLFYTYYIKRNFKISFLVLSCISFALSALSKSSSVVLPLILLLWDYYYDRKWDKRLILEKIPFVIISLTLGILTLNVRKDVVPPVDYTLFDRGIMFLFSLADYMFRLVFPIGLSMSYAYPAKDGMFLPFYFYLAPFILCLIVWGFYKLKVPKKILIIGLLFFALNIFLSQSVLLIDNFKANRYAYLSYIGLFFILAYINEQILDASDGWRFTIKRAWVTTLLIFAIVFSFLTYTRTFVWQDTITLFDDVVAKQPNIPWVYSNRGIAKFRNNDFQGALQDFNHSLELDPSFTLSLYYRGVISYQSNNYEQALVDLDQAVANTPDFSNAYNDRAMVRRALQDYQGAIDDLSQAIALNAYFVQAYGNRGIVKNDIGDYQGAIDDLSTAIELDPAYAEAFYIRSIAQFNLNNRTGSCDDAQMAVSLGYPEASQQIEQACS